MNIQIVQDSTIIQLSDTIRTIVISPHETFVESLSQPGIIIAITAIAISIIGLFISVWYNRKTLNITVEHNRKSVEPLLNTDYSLTYTNKYESLRISNKGIGPAIIEKISYRYKGEIFNNILLIYYKFYPEYILKIEPDGFTYTSYTPGKTAISQNSELLLYEIRYSNNDHFKELHEFSDEIMIEISYKTIYGEERYID